MKTKEPTLQEVLAMAAEETNEDKSSKLQAYPGETTIVFKWRDPVAMANKLKISMDDAEQFFIYTIVYPKDRFRIQVRDRNGRKFRESVWIFLLGELYVKALLEEYGYRMVSHAPKVKKTVRRRTTTRHSRHRRNTRVIRQQTVRRVHKRRIRRTCR